MQSNILSVKETRLYEYEYDCNHVKVVKTCRRNSETQTLGRDTNKTYLGNLAWMKQNQIKLLKVYSGQKNELAKTILAV